MPDAQPSLPPLPIFGIVGGVGSGKSAVARWVAEREPSIRIFDADAAGHEVLKDPEIKQQLRQTFGEAIFLPTGDVDRKVLAERVFGPGRESHRAQLEAIVHPAIQRNRELAIARWTVDPSVSAVIVDAALLLEAGWADRCDAIIFVETPAAIRRQRVESRGWSDGELDRREASQWSLERKREAADFVIDNSLTLDISGARLYQYIQHRSRPPT